MNATVLPSMKPWLQHYPSTIPPEIDPGQYESLNAFFAESVRKFADQPAFQSFGVVKTFRQVDDAATCFAGWLQSQRIVPGSRVALMMPNLFQYPIAVLGVLRAGCVVVNCNPLYTSRELEFQLRDSGACAIVILENFATTLQNIVEKTAVQNIVITSVGEMLGGAKGPLINFVLRRIKKAVPRYEMPAAYRSSTLSFNQALWRGGHHSFRKVAVTATDPAFLQYTGGTTGTPKGAVLTHRNMVANVLQAHAWVKAYLEPGKETILTPLPLYHIFALTANFLLFSHLGAKNILIANPRDLPAFIKLWSKEKVSVITGVNTLYNALLNQPGFDKLDFSPLKICLGGGAAVQRAIAEHWQQTTGCTLTQAYGLSETAPAATINPIDLGRYSPAIGLPIPSTEIAIRDEMGQDLPCGENHVGEICIRGPQVMAGYWQKPEETKNVMTADGFFKTGDMGYMDESGYVVLVDRKKDMAIVSGFKVFPNEVEEVIAALPGVFEIAVIAVQDEKSGEAVKAFIVRKDPTLTAEQVLKHARANLVAYKVPKHIEFRDELPHSNIGKILRRVLQEGEVSGQTPARNA